MRISLANSQAGFSAAADQPLLDAALAAGFDLAHRCRGGNCGACMARLVRGTIDYPNGAPLGLSDAQVRDGLILLCQARARCDLVLELFTVHAAGTAPAKRLPCRIERHARLSHDVMAIHLRLPAAETFDFQPGQYLDVMLGGGRRRSFSIASPPHDARLIELHVRRVDGGEFTASIFDGDPGGRLLTIEGPLGAFYYRPGAASPLLLVGGGTGLAPLKSIYRHVVENGIERDITLYWGARAERDLYARRELLELTQRVPRFRYHEVLSAPEPGWRGRSGPVHAAVLDDAVRIADLDIYASGPPAMIDALRRDFVRGGADPARLFADSFDYAPDSLERQRTSASTKS